MKFLPYAVLLLTLASTSVATAQDPSYRVLLGIDPSDDVGQQEQLLGEPLAPSLSSALENYVQVKQTTNLTDVMRATYTEENDIVIGPPHITASAINHGYQLMARNIRNARFVLIARSGVAHIEDMNGKRLYLTQQDSTRAYLAKGMLREANFNITKFRKITYGKTSGAGLLALQSNLCDVTVAEESEATRWMESHPGIATILKISREVPAGMAIAVKKNMAPAERKALLAWVDSPAARSAGLGRLQAASAIDKELYNYIAALDIATPVALPSAAPVNAQ